jgi:hypothetical protein
VQWLQLGNDGWSPQHNLRKVLMPGCSDDPDKDLVS